MTFIKPEDITIGTKFLSAGKHKKLCVVIDIYKTYNHVGELVKTRYGASHEFLGQVINEYDIPAVTIQKGNLELQKLCSLSTPKQIIKDKP